MNEPGNGGAAFRPQARISSASEHDRLLRKRAGEEAAALFAQRGAGAVDTVGAEMRQQELTAEERRYYRLVIADIERLDRSHRRSLAGFPSFGGSMLAFMQRRLGTSKVIP